MLAVLATIAFIYTGFGLFCVVAWGNELTTPLVTDFIPQGQIAWWIKILFAINLVFSFPLVLFPGHIVIENYLYVDWPKSKKR